MHTEVCKGKGHDTCNLFSLNLEIITYIHTQNDKASGQNVNIQ